MNTIYIEGHVTSLNLYKKIMNHFNKMIKEANASLLHEIGVGVVKSLQYDGTTYARFEIGREETYIAFSGFWDLNPECEKNLEHYCGIFKTTDRSGWWKVYKESNQRTFFADQFRFTKIACGLYKWAKKYADPKHDQDVFYMWDYLDVLIIVGDSMLHLSYDGDKIVSLYRLGDFDFIGEDNVAEVNGVSFFAPETDIQDEDEEPENNDED